MVNVSVPGIPTHRQAMFALLNEIGKARRNGDKKWLKCAIRRVQYRNRVEICPIPK